MKIKVYSTTTCPYCVMAKDYFKKKGVPFEDINVSEDRAAAQEMIDKSGQMGVPVIDIDGELVIGFDVPRIEKILSRKSQSAEEDSEDSDVGIQDSLSSAKGPDEEPYHAPAPVPLSHGRMPEKEVHHHKKPNNECEGIRCYDVIIIGGSAAGLTAALFATRREMDTLVIAKDIGGQISETPRVDNWPGTFGIAGPNLVNNIKEHADFFGTEIRMEEVTSIEVEDIDKETYGQKRRFVCRTKDGDDYHAYSLIIATGKTPRSLNVPGEDEFLGKGISYCANCDAPLFAGKTVAVVGGGNSAFDAALFLSKIAKKVYLIHRRDEFRAFEAAIHNLKSRDNVEYLLNTVITKVDGDRFVKEIALRNTNTGKEDKVKVDGVFIEIGSVVKTEFAKGIVDMDELGHIRINSFTETSHPGIFAAGDVTNIPFKQIVVAAGDGCKAALAAYNYLHDIENKYVADWTKYNQSKE